MFAINAEKARWKAALKAITVAEGVFNAVVLSWRLSANLMSALNEETCLWRHPYVDGAAYLMDGSSLKGLLMTVLVSMCPPMTTSLQQGLLIPLAWFWSNWGYRKGEMTDQAQSSGNALICLLIIAMAPTVIFCLIAVIGVVVVTTFSFPVVGILALFPFISSRFTMWLWIEFEKRKHRKTEHDELPVWLRDNWESWMVGDSQDSPRGDADAHATIRLYFLLFGFVGVNALFGSLSEFSLFVTSWQRSVTGVREDANVLTVYTEFMRQNLDDAYLRFYGRFTLPEYLENFITPGWWSNLAYFGIDAQMFIATINSIILFVVSLLPC